jgi:hypothetical protein
MRFWGGWLGAALIAGWALNLIWWFLLEPAAASATVSELVIPRGTADAIRTGAPAFVPGAVSLPRGSTELRVRNEDTIEHRVGEWGIPPGAVSIIRVKADGALTCTVHPSGYLDLALSARPPLKETILPTLLIGVPAGLAIAIAITIGQRLGMDDDPPPDEIGA